LIPQISVLDTGGQYCHLIARRVRELGVYADVQPHNVAAGVLADRKGVIVSGGPASVYEPDSPKVDVALYSSGPAVLGICYGLQLMTHSLGGEVAKGEQGEYGKATLLLRERQTLLDGFEAAEPVWMSHRDRVVAPPAGFALLAETDTCPVAAIGDSQRRLYGVQFHPEVVHTRRGMELLKNFLFRICGCERDWEPSRQLPEIERQIREVAGDRNVLFFASGGVDSTVAVAMCLRALGPERVHAVYVDTGLMREGETEFVRATFEKMAEGVFEVVDASAEFLGALSDVTEPEAKRHIIGEEFVRVQERILERGHFLDGHWILGQGTIYPDTIESGGTKQADLIKTHHNRVASIQRLIEQNRLVEPLRDLYKDEVRILGRTLGLPHALLDRHPFPGPGLAIRCLCSDADAPIQRLDERSFVAPVRSVGVQGDSRTYRSVLVLASEPSEVWVESASALVNRMADVNRAVAWCAGHDPLDALIVHRAGMTHERLERLRAADAAVRRLSEESGFESEVWQFPVVLIPLGTNGRPDSIVLRPIHSVDGMTASPVLMPRELLAQMSDSVLAIPGVSAVFYDLTNKPPATIEWE
jgi:GMP synthase (glutamine-hydrolysing)